MIETNGRELQAELLDLHPAKVEELKDKLQFWRVTCALLLVLCAVLSWIAGGGK